MRITRLMTTAAHEAAHGLVGHVSGWKIRGASIMRGERSRGRITVDIPNTATIVQRLAFHQAGEAAVSLIGTLGAPTALAGRWFFELPDGSHDVHGSMCDEVAVTRLRPTADQVTLAERRANVLLVRHWKAVIAAADELLEHGVMEGERMHAIFDRYGVPRSTAPPKQRQKPRPKPRQAATGSTLAEQMAAIGVEVVPIGPAGMTPSRRIGLPDRRRISDRLVGGSVRC